MKNAGWLVFIGALAVGLLAGWSDFHATEPQGTALMILASAFVFGALDPRFAWLSALFVGGGVGAVAAIARSLGMQPTDPVPPNPWWAGIVLPLILAFVAAYAGALFRWTIAKTREPVSR